MSWNRCGHGVDGKPGTYRLACRPFGGRSAIAAREAVPCLLKNENNYNPLHSSHTCQVIEKMLEQLLRAIGIVVDLANFRRERITGQT